MRTLRDHDCDDQLCACRVPRRRWWDAWMAVRGYATSGELHYHSEALRLEIERDYADDRAELRHRQRHRKR